MTVQDQHLNYLVAARLNGMRAAIALAAESDPPAVVMTTLTEPPDDATDEDRRRWDRSCDLCGTWCPEDTEFWTGSTTPPGQPVQVIVTFGVCGPCHRGVTT